MVTKKIELLKNTRARVARLERVIATQLRRELTSLPRKYGFADVEDFISAVRNCAGKPIASAGHKIAGKRRKQRVVITGNTKAQVKSLVAAGKTGSEIAEAVGISIPSVQNIKKELGLVKRRGK